MDSVPYSRDFIKTKFTRITTKQKIRTTFDLRERNSMIEENFEFWTLNVTYYIEQPSHLTSVCIISKQPSILHRRSKVNLVFHFFFSLDHNERFVTYRND